MFDFISLCLVKVKNIITFLITGKITIPMYGLYIIISLSATLGLFVATLCFAAKEADRRIEMVNTVELARHKAEFEELERRIDMTDQIEKIIDKIHDEYRGLSRSEIEKIVRQTIEEIQRKERKELADTVRGTD